MSFNDWQRIRQALSGAIQCAPGDLEQYLDDVCEGDPEFRHEVEDLLHADDSAARIGFLESSPVSPLPIDLAIREILAGPDPSSGQDDSRTSVPERVGPYRVVERIGQGGMGVVYRAEDRRLGRAVALKFLSPELVRNQEAIRRFTQEACAASALDHPNICNIHDVGETSDGQHYIAMAYYEGETLAHRIHQAPLGLGEALGVCVQILDGLEAAHRAGIVHRDIKLANMIMTGDGLVKILDFGLAKLHGDHTLTPHGGEIGTVSYMSPEQLRGEAPDAGTDLWSVGVCLYEMVTGQLPFPGSVGETVRAIETEHPVPISSFKPGLRVLDEVMLRALSKTTENRYRSAGEFRSDILRLRDHGESPGVPEIGRAAVIGQALSKPAKQPIAKRPIAKRAWGGAVLLAVAAISVLYFWPSFDPGPQLAAARRVTFDDARLSSPSWSPDGDLLAYMSNVSGNWDVWVFHEGVGQPVNRTVENPQYDGAPSWSPNGDWIAFASGREGGGIFVMPAFGGLPKKVTSEMGNSVPQWSPDGRTLANIVEDDNGTCVVEFLDLELRTSHQLPLSGNRPIKNQLSWSPNGRFLAYVEEIDLGSDMNRLWVLRLEDGVGIPITSGTTWIQSPAWYVDDRAVYFVSNQGGSRELWRQPLESDGRPSGDAHPKTNGAEMLRADFSRNGAKLAYSSGAAPQGVTNIWRVPILDERSATWEDAEQLTNDMALPQLGDVSPDGSLVVFESDRTGNLDLWTIDTSGGEPRRILGGPHLDWNPQWSPDGREIVFYSNRSGNRDIWILPMDGSPLRQITDTSSEEWAPDWSPDARQIVFLSDRSGKIEVWVASAEGTEARRLTFDEGWNMHPHWSPDGQWIYYTSYSGGTPSARRILVEGGESELVEAVAFHLMPAKDGESLRFIGRGERAGGIWSLPVRGGEAKLLADLSGKEVCLSVFDGSESDYLYFTWHEKVTIDLWVRDVE